MVSHHILISASSSTSTHLILSLASLLTSLYDTCSVIFLVAPYLLCLHAVVMALRIRYAPLKKYREA